MKSINPRVFSRLLTITVCTAALALAGACSDPDPGPGTGDGIGGDIAFPDGEVPDGESPDGAEDGDSTASKDVDTDTTGPDPCADCKAPAVCVETFCVAPAPGGCAPGETNGCGAGDQILKCDATGTAFIPANCDPGFACKEGECKPAICTPGQSLCAGLSATKTCKDDGSGFGPTTDCPGTMYCVAATGACTDTCVSDPKFGAYVGCAYWTVDLPNWPDPTIQPTPEDKPHALVVANPNGSDATLTFEAPDGVVVDITDPVVPAGQSRVFLMPVINTDGSGIGARGIRVTSTRPVLVHQFNPWDAVYSNDASLLLPESLLGTNYTILSWPTDARGSLNEIDIKIPGFEPPELPDGFEFGMEDVNSFFTVAAPQNDTEVTFTVTGPIAAGVGVKAMNAGESQTVTLARGEVLNVECSPKIDELNAGLKEMEGLDTTAALIYWFAHPELGEAFGALGTCDLSGSTVSSNKPVSVFAGQESAGIGHPNPAPDADSCCLDHLEEQMLPQKVLGTNYVAVKTRPRGNDPDLWRIQAAEDGVTVTTSPAQAGANGVTLAKRGDYVDVWTESSFEITGTGKLQIGQYLIGGGDTNQGNGDPSLLLAAPVERFRDFYVVTIPPGFDKNYVTIVRPAGVTISGSAGVIPDGDFTAIGSGTWEAAYLELPPGVHKLAGEAKFGLSLYGYDSANSYGTLGGLD